jgi:predicted nicotinamide N-methyase
VSVTHQDLAVAVADPAAFIIANTLLLPVALVPEMRLHVADEAVPLWTKTEDEINAIGLPPPFWAFAWAGGQALARYVLDNPAQVAGKTVIDLASGSGIVAIAAAKAGAARLIAYDIDRFARMAIELNARINDVVIEVCGEDLLEGAAAPVVQTILAGDIFYEDDTAKRALAFLRARAAQGATVLIGDPGRSFLPKDRLRKIAEYRVPVSRELEDADIKHSAVWALA